MTGRAMTMSAPLSSRSSRPAPPAPSQDDDPFGLADSELLSPEELRALLGEDGEALEDGKRE